MTGWWWAAAPSPEEAGLQTGGPRFPGVSPSRNPRGTRSGPNGAQNRAGARRVRHRSRTGHQLDGGSSPPGSHHQRHGKDGRGRLIDPFGGREDLRRRRLRHVADAFAEDPLRVFRVARFAAALEGFEVHPETQAFMAGMAASLSELAAERVWREFSKALAAPAPQRFLEVLKDCGCLSPWFPELETAAIDPSLGRRLAPLWGPWLGLSPPAP